MGGENGRGESWCRVVVLALAGVDGLVPRNGTRERIVWGMGENDGLAEGSLAYESAPSGWWLEWGTKGVHHRRCERRGRAWEMGDLS